MKIAIVGSGFAGAVLAHILARTEKHEIHVIEQRDHIGGNCHTKINEETGILVHQYGPHIFNTNNKEVWDYINQFDEFYPYINRVKAIVNNKIYSLPINLMTINQVFNQNFNPATAKKFIESIAFENIECPKNFEEQALKYIGQKLYKMFFYGYTKKQWGVDPTEIDSSVLKRLPVRFNYNDNYYQSKYQGIPINGYTHIIENMLKSPNIKIHLKTKYNKYDPFDYVFYSGPIDEYFHYSEGLLGYRTLNFDNKIEYSNDYQGNAVINYCDQYVPYTRIIEHKHFAPWKKTNKTIITKEYSKKADMHDIKYYPTRFTTDKNILEKYKIRMKYEKNVKFIGRLGTYRYLNMDKVIEESIIIANDFIDPKNERNHHARR